MSLSVRILTLNGVLWDADAEELILPSSTGLLGILPGHAALLTSLDIGVVRIKSNKDPVAIVVIEGFAEVRKGEVIIVSNTAEDRRAHVWTPVTQWSRMPSSAWKKKKTKKKHK